MLESMTAAQLEEWRVYDSIHPFGDARTEIEFARLVTVIKNALGEKAETAEQMWSFEVAKPDPKQRAMAKIRQIFGITHG